LSAEQRSFLADLSKPLNCRMFSILPPHLLQNGNFEPDRFSIGCPARERLRTTARVPYDPLISILQVRIDAAAQHSAGSINGATACSGAVRSDTYLAGLTFGWLAKYSVGTQIR